MPVLALALSAACFANLALVLAMVVALIALRRMIARHEAWLAALRGTLTAYDTLRKSGGRAERVVLRPQQGSSSRWVDLVMTMPGLSLRYPIEADEIDELLDQVRDARRYLAYGD